MIAGRLYSRLFAEISGMMRSSCGDGARAGWLAGFRSANGLFLLVQFTLAQRYCLERQVISPNSNIEETSISEPSEAK